MFSMIIVIIAIALVVVLAGAGLYYGGESWQDGRAKSDAAKYRNQASQIVGAINLYRATEGGLPETFALTDLVTGDYLKELPEGQWSTEPGSNRIIRTGLSERQCLAANKSAGFTFSMSDSGASTNYTEVEGGKAIPNCSWAGLDSATPCCSS